MMIRGQRRGIYGAEQNDSACGISKSSEVICTGTWTLRRPFPSSLLRLLRLLRLARMVRLLRGFPELLTLVQFTPATDRCAKGCFRS